MQPKLTPNNLTFFESATAFRQWLEENHDTAAELHLGYYKKGTGRPSITYPESVDEALCFGWIDGIRNAVDDECYTVRFTPRKKTSIWSKKNIENVERLTADGKMHPAGLMQVEAAKADGRWEAAYDGGSKAGVPDDLQAFLDAHPDAKAFYEGLKRANQYAILFRLQTARKPETRAKRMAQITKMLLDGESFHPLM